jgi:two-component system, response regulator PdtaR
MSAAPASNDQAAAARSPTVLLVEDEILIRMMVAAELRTAGYVVVEAANADEALKFLQTSDAVDLMITDIAMPGSMNGAGLAIRVHATWPNTKIVIASAHAPEWPASTVVHTFVGKPYDPDRLVDRVRWLLE